jgi:2-dehydro-3-deoxyphosphogluconate aldolase/(4S)-4-hydroxy-2-oxoglutarate aldolase
MSKAEAMQRIRDTGLVPVVRAESADQAMRAIDAINAGGINLIEVSMTVPGAVRVIEQLADRYGSEVLIGAGTGLDAETARICMLG